MKRKGSCAKILTTSVQEKDAYSTARKINTSLPFFDETLLIIQ